MAKKKRGKVEVFVDAKSVDLPMVIKIGGKVIGKVPASEPVRAIALLTDRGYPYEEAYNVVHGALDRFSGL